MRLSLFKLRLFYLMTGLSGGVLVPYLSILFDYDGFTSTEMGVIMAIGTFVSVLVQPGWGYVVDRFHITRLTLTISSFVPGVVAIAFGLHWLWWVVFANVIFNLFSTPQTPIADSFTINAVRNTKHSYGSVRLFGSLGFAIGGLIGGIYVAYLPVSTLWILYFILGIIGAIVAVSMPVSPNSNPEKTDEKDKTNLQVGSIGQGVSQLLHDSSFLFFLLGGFLASQTLAGFNTYFALTFHSIGGSLKLTGLAFFLASATNVPAMLMSGWVIKKLGRENVLVLASFAYVIRWGVQAFVHVPIVSILIQVLHGISFGFYYIASVHFVSESAGRELQATAQTIFGVVCSGMAGIVGNLLNGYLLSVGGSDMMYSACALSAFLAAICFWVVGRQRVKLTVPATQPQRAISQ